MVHLSLLSLLCLIRVGTNEGRHWGHGEDLCKCHLYVTNEQTKQVPDWRSTFPFGSTAPVSTSYYWQIPFPILQEKDISYGIILHPVKLSSIASFLWPVVSLAIHPHPLPCPKLCVDLTPTTHKGFPSCWSRILQKRCLYVSRVSEMVSIRVSFLCVWQYRDTQNANWGKTEGSFLTFFFLFKTSAQP